MPMNIENYQNLHQSWKKSQILGKMSQYVVNAKNEVIPKSIAIGTLKIKQQLKEKKQVHVNEVYVQSKTTRNPYKRNRNNKINNSTTQYSCFICGGSDHKIFDYLHCQATLEMLKNKKANFKSKKENVVINMVLAVTTRVKSPKLTHSRKRK